MPKSKYSVAQIDALLEAAGSAVSSSDLTTAVAELKTLINAIDSGMTIQDATSGQYYRFWLVEEDGYTRIEIRGPVITADPDDADVSAGTTVTFTVEATGSGLTYQWQWRSSSSGTWADSTGTGYNTKTFSVTATKGRNGYQYRCVVTDEDGEAVVSAAATLVVS